MNPSNLSYRIVADRHEIWIGKKEVKLAPKEFILLSALHASQKTMTRQELASIIWPGKKPPKCTRTIDQHLARIRRKMWPGVVLTVPTVGYKIGITA